MKTQEKKRILYHTNTHQTTDDVDYIPVKEKKNLTFQPDERKLRQTTITLIYMRRDLCKLIIANDLIEH